MTQKKTLTKHRIKVTIGLFSALGLVTAAVGQITANNLYDRELAEFIKECSTSDGRLLVSFRGKSRSWFNDVTELKFLVNDETGTYDGVFTMKSSIFPFYVSSELIPETVSIKEFFEKKNLENIKLRSSVFGTRLSVTGTDRRVPLPAYLFEQCGAEKINFELDADLYKNLPFGKLPVSFTAESLSCYAKGVFGERQSLYLQDFSLTTTLDKLFTAEGLSTPVFARVKAERAQLRFGQNNFIFKDVTVNHELLNGDKEGLFFSFSVGEGRDLSTVMLKGTNDRTDEKQFLKGNKHGEYKLSLLGHLFNNSNNGLMVSLVHDGYLTVNGQKLESDVLFDAFFSESPEPVFRLIVNGKKVDTKELARALLFPSIKGTDLARKAEGLSGEVPVIR